MEVYCTRPHCQRPKNHFIDLDDIETLKTVPEKFCTTCGMPLILGNRYLPIKLLAVGGFGAAFLAIDRHTPTLKRCVVKQFQPSGNLTEAALKKAQKLFTQEAETLEKIGYEHPQIPNLFADFTITVDKEQINESEQFFYLVQEYIDGQTLEEELEAQGNFSEEKVREILRNILPVLQFIHDKDIIHRDIKPSNIMRHRDGRLFLLDFGAVKLIAHPSSTSTGIYSRGFAPPEQMQGGQVFPSTDLYALAVTSLILLTGKGTDELFDSYNNQWQWRSHVNINTRLADILDKMLLPAANQRFQSAQEVLEAIQLTTPIKPTFTTWELSAGSAFSGFEATLIAIAFFALFKNPIMALAISMVILSALIFAQIQRWLKQSQLLIIVLINLAIIFFMPYLYNNYTIQQIIILALSGALISMAITTLFRLIYKLISSIL
jgi:serine/threonine protein kinase